VRGREESFLLHCLAVVTVAVAAAVAAAATAAAATITNQLYPAGKTQAAAS